jgi:GNAT superfamily N-acetyltransferase
MPDAGTEFSIHRYDALPDPKVLRTAYADYMDEIGRFIAHLHLEYSAPHWWWETDADVDAWALAGPGRRLVGFSITGHGTQVDDDVDSEILEFYVKPVWRGHGCARRLFEHALTRLRGRAGLQAYSDNKPACAFWQHMLRTHDIDFVTQDVYEGRIPVTKFRFTTPRTS